MAPIMWLEAPESMNHIGLKNKQQFLGLQERPIADNVEDAVDRILNGLLNFI